MSTTNQVHTIAVTGRQRWELAQLFLNIKVKGQELRKIFRARRALGLDPAILAVLERQACNTEMVKPERGPRACVLTIENIETVLERLHGLSNVHTVAAFYLGELVDTLETAKASPEGLTTDAPPLDVASEEWMPKTEPPILCPHCEGNFTMSESTEAARRLQEEEQRKRAAAAPPEADANGERQEEQPAAS